MLLIKDDFMLCIRERQVRELVTPYLVSHGKGEKNNNSTENVMISILFI